MVLHATFLFFAPRSLRIAHALRAQCALVSCGIITTLRVSGAHYAIIARAIATCRNHMRITHIIGTVGYSRCAQLPRNAQSRAAGNLRWLCVVLFVFVTAALAIILLFALYFLRIWCHACVSQHTDCYCRGFVVFVSIRIGWQSLMCLPVGPTI